MTSVLIVTDWVLVTLVEQSSQVFAFPSKQNEKLSLQQVTRFTFFNIPKDINPVTVIGYPLHLLLHFVSPFQVVFMQTVSRL